MGNKSSSGRKTSIFRPKIPKDQNFILEEPDRLMLEANWSQIKKTHPQLYVNAWLGAINASPDIRKVFDIKKPEAALENQALIQTIEDVETFFDQIVVQYEFALESCQEECRALGARHANYSHRYFTPGFWDVFMESLVRSFEEEMNAEKETDLLLAWQNLIEALVEQMKIGYEKGLAD